MNRDLTQATYKRITWDDVVSSRFSWANVAKSPLLAYDELPSEKTWVLKPFLLYGGYYVSTNGDCYIPY